jgi:hypothetical protein
MPRGKADAKPRGRMTAYAFFVQTCREEHKKKHPDENVIFAEFSKKCAERWKVSCVIYFFLSLYLRTPGYELVQGWPQWGSHKIPFKL